MNNSAEFQRSILANSELTDLSKLNLIFNAARDDVSANNAQVYHAVVHVLYIDTDKGIKNLQAAFDINKVDIKNRWPQLYYAILGYLDSNKKPYSASYFSQE